MSESGDDGLCVAPLHDDGSTGQQRRTLEPAPVGSVLQLVEYALAGSEESEMLTREKPLADTEPIGGSATLAITSSQTARDGQVRATPAIRDPILRVEGEYREMPGLNLTLPQAARLLGLDQNTCERVLAILIERRVLKRTSNGTYVRRRFGQAR